MFANLVRIARNTLFPHTEEIIPSLDIYFSPGLHQETVYLLPYSNPAVKASIANTKYHRHHASAQRLTEQLDRYLTRFNPNTLSIIPIPQSYQRWRERGFNHLEEIISKSAYHATYRPHILKKQLHAKRQAHVSKTERLQQQVGTFRCLPAAAELQGTVILFDDVTTTGATMRAAKTALEQNLTKDAKLVCLSMAH